MNKLADKQSTAAPALASPAFAAATATGPGWRGLTTAVALVVAAHVLILQASPAQLGASPDPDDAGGKILTTRAIQAAPLVAAAAPAAVPAVAATKAPNAVKAAESTPKGPSNQPAAQQTRVRTAPEIIAIPDAAIAVPTVPAAPEAPVTPADAKVAATPTQAVPALVTAATPPAGLDTKTTPVTAISLPGSTRLLYQVLGLSKNLNYQATSELTWKTNGDNYEVMMKVSAFLVGSRSMTSVGKITGSGLAPTRFADKFRAELAAHFEPDKGKITFSTNTPDAPWIEGVQDRVSVFVQLGGMLAARPQDFAPGSNITFLTIGPREADTWTFVVEAEETLSLMGAPMPTLKLTRKPRKEFDQKVEIWFAPSLGYLPVRNRVTQQGGDFIDQQLTGVVK